MKTFIASAAAVGALSAAALGVAGVAAAAPFVESAETVSTAQDLGVSPLSRCTILNVPHDLTGIGSGRRSDCLSAVRLH